MTSYFCTAISQKTAQPIQTTRKPITRREDTASITMARVPCFEIHESVVVLIDDVPHRGTIASRDDDDDPYSYIVRIEQVFGPIYL